LFCLIFAEAVCLSDGLKKFMSIPLNVRWPVSGTALDEKSLTPTPLQRRGAF
jgi:hypothetical protein